MRRRGDQGGPLIKNGRTVVIGCRNRKEQKFLPISLQLDFINDNQRSFVLGVQEVTRTDRNYIFDSPKRGDQGGPLIKNGRTVVIGCRIMSLKML
jgi:hypothetical protein